MTTLRELAAWQGYPGLVTVLNDPRISHVNGDGRRYLSRSRERFDIIQADAYFRLLRDRLAPGGLAVSWAPTDRVLRTFLGVFPHVGRHGQIVVGSDRPLAIDPEAIRHRLADRRVQDYYGASGIDITRLLAPLMEGWQMYGPSDPRPPGDINTDLYPRDEFDIPPLVRLARRGDD